jgi:hypothetical protein
MALHNALVLVVKQYEAVNLKEQASMHHGWSATQHVGMVSSITANMVL